MVVVTPDVAGANATGANPSANGNFVETPDVGAASAGAIGPTVSWGNTVIPAAGNARGRGSRPYTDAVADRGRQPIAVDQPLGGSSYPFQREEAFPGDLVADAYLSYEDDACEFVRPFRIGMLYGFGTIVNDVPAGFPDSTHDYDIVILDAEDRVVFDSTVLANSRVTNQFWGNRLQIVEWRGDAATCRVVVHTAWSPNQTPQPLNIYVAPPAAILDERVSERLPSRVRSIRIDDVTLQATDVEFAEGYNTALTLDAPTVSGLRRVNTLNVDSAPGGGLGRFSDCDEDNLTIKRINGSEPDDRGAFQFDMGQCYRVEQPYTLDDFDRAVRTPATLQFTNDCGPCADCPDFLRVYEAVRAMYARFVALGGRAEAVRDQYAANKTRWENEASCRRSNRLQLAVSTVCPCFVSIAVGFCNITDDTTCLSNLELRLNVSGTAVDLGSGPCGGGYRIGNLEACPPPSPACNNVPTKVLPYTPVGTWPQMSIFFDNVAPNGRAIGTMQLEFPGCETGQNITLIARAYRNGSLLDGPLTATFDLAAPDVNGDCCPEVAP